MNLEIIFLSRVRYPGYFIYLVNLKNNGNENIEYDMSKMTSLNGTNVLSVSDTFHFRGNEVLTSGELGEDEEIEGYVAFIKNDFVTNEPTFFYENNEYKVSRTI